MAAKPQRRRAMAAADDGLDDPDPAGAHRVHLEERLHGRRAACAPRDAGAAALALAALDASCTARALYGGRGFALRNVRWTEVAAVPARWTLAEPGGFAWGRLEDAAAALARGLLASNAITSRTALVRDGGDATVELRLERVDARGERLVLALAEDVTERVRAEREAATARDAALVEERMQLLGELASGVAHDVNNTLHALSLRIGHLAATPLEARQRENVEALARICADAAERVARLQDLARRREDVPTESFDVSAVVQEAVAAARAELDERARARAVRYEVEAELAPGVQAVGSAAELRHVFVSLILNARDAMPRGGRIRITSRVADGRAEVTVRDGGTGIPPEHLERLFDPFFTTKGPVGMGLGLAVVQGVMRRLGGQISAANAAGGGAAFTLTFPLPAGHAALAREPVAEVPGHRLLVVDDDLDNLEATRYVLEDLGHEVDLAPCGEDALQLFAEGRRYDLVLCDVGMPGMNGWQVAEEVKRLAPGTRVVLVTGWAAEIAPDDPKRRWVDAVLGKPLDLGDLRRALAERLGARSR